MPFLLNRLSLGRAEYKITLYLPITADALMFSRRQESRGEFGDQRDLGSENSAACLCRADHKRVTPVEPVITLSIEHGDAPHSPLAV